MTIVTSPDGARHTVPPEEAYLFKNATPRRLDAWAELHRALFPDPTQPGHGWEEQVAAYLFDRGYHPESIGFVLEDARAWGTVELSRELSFSEFDRRVVERIIPDAADGDWDREPFRGVWNLG